MMIELMNYVLEKFYCLVGSVVFHMHCKIVLYGT